MLVYLNILFKYLHVVYSIFHISYLFCVLVLQRKQHTVTRDKKEIELIARGRHDPCVVPRGMSSDSRMIFQIFEKYFRTLMI
jgi:hypothetical protein